MRSELGVVALVVVWVALAFVVARQAASIGQSFRGWFIAGLVAWPLAIIVLTVLSFFAGHAEGGRSSSS